VLLIFFGIGNKFLNIFKRTWSSRAKRGQEIRLKSPLAICGAGNSGDAKGAEGISRFSA
jgi:hypothetical protein